MALPDPERAALRYQGPSLRTVEQEQAAGRVARQAELRQLLVDGPVLRLGLAHMKIQFNPLTVESLGALGSVYPTLRVVADWGTLEVTRAALLSPDWSMVTVSAPASAAGNPATGDGWTLSLAPGWTLEPDERAGDFRAVKVR